MQVIILCGGDGTRMYPKTEVLPKSMIYIGDKPILWYIMNQYSKHGHKDFLLLVGFKKEKVEEYFNNPENIEPDWRIQYSNAGANASKGDRLRKALEENKIKEDRFLFAYGDDLCSVNINDVIKKHEENGALVTITAVRPISDFGILELNGNDTVKYFKEKPILNHWISGGYIVMDKRVVAEYMTKGGDETDAFEELAKHGKVQVFKHNGFWKTMNTIKDMKALQELWDKGELQKQLGI